MFPRSRDRGLIEASPSNDTANAVACFRDREIAASLKLIIAIVFDRGSGLFPRSRDRGLIEAMLRRFHAGCGHPFPRSRDRGLIEALRIRSTRMHDAAFPRSRDRGLIEAPPGYVIAA